MTVQTTEYSSTGAFCAIHPHRGAVATCDHCGTFACPECITLDGDKQICATCIREGRVEVGDNPWARRWSIGVLPAAWQTLLAVTTSPGRFFGSLGTRGTVGEAVMFQALVILPAFVMTAIYGQLTLLAFGDMIVQFFEQFASQMPPGTMDELRDAMNPGPADMAKAVGMNLLIGPPIWILILLVLGVVQHVFITVVGGAKHDLERSLEALFYAAGVRFWEIIPLVNWIGIPWLLTVQSIALTRVHDSDGWRGAVGGWGPALALCCCCFGGFFALGFFGAMFA